MNDEIIEGASSAELIDELNFALARYSMALNRWEIIQTNKKRTLQVNMMDYTVSIRDALAVLGASYSSDNVVKSHNNLAEGLNNYMEDVVDIVTKTIDETHKIISILEELYKREVNKKLSVRTNGD